MRKNSIIIVAIVLIELLSNFSFGQSTYTVTISGFQFIPQSLTNVKVGDNVIWKNQETSQAHTTKSTSNWDSGNLNSNATYTFTPTQTGTYNYVCAYHSSMTGSITVSAATGLPDDNFITREILLYPNPVQNTIKFSDKLVAQSSATSAKSIEIYDVKGILIKTESVNSLSDGLDVSTLKSGNYLLKIPQINKTISFMKQ